METIGQYQNILVMKRSELEKFLSGYLSCTFVESDRRGCPDVMFHTIVKQDRAEGKTISLLKSFKGAIKYVRKYYGHDGIELLYTEVLELLDCMAYHKLIPTGDCIIKLKE